MCMVDWENPSDVAVAEVWKTERLGFGQNIGFDFNSVLFV